MLQLGDLRSFLHFDTQHLSLNTTGMSTTWSKRNGLQLWDLDCLLTDSNEESAGPAQQTSITLSVCFNRRISVENHGNLHLRHDRDVDDMPRRLRTWRCTITGMSTWSKNCTQKPVVARQRACHHLVQELQLWNSTGSTVWTITPVLHNNGQDTKTTTCTTGTSTTTSKKSRNAARDAASPAPPPPPPQPATTTPRPPPTPFTTACLKNSSLGSFMMNSASASTPEPVRPPTTRARPCRATSLAPRRGWW